jgi:hypothetical protein
MNFRTQPALAGPDRRKLRQVHLIWDGGASHVATDTQQFLHNEFPRVRPLLTPAHAS